MEKLIEYLAGARDGGWEYHDGSPMAEDIDLALSILADNEATGLQDQPKSEDASERPSSFVEQFGILTNYIHQTARKKGFWATEGERSIGELIALCHSELSEALETVRHGNPPDDKIPEFSGLEAELADLIIRVIDMSGGLGLRLGEAIIAKVRYNEGRAYKHGKVF
jgi:NTP pyrophosphatase (non-canonical NTP hydrolase)